MSRNSGSLGITVKYKNDWFTKHIHKQGSHSDHLDETISGIGNFGWFGHSEVSTMTSLAILGSQNKPKPNIKWSSEFRWESANSPRKGASRIFLICVWFVGTQYNEVPGKWWLEVQELLGIWCRHWGMFFLTTLVILGNTLFSR